ncbi:MAG TPA: hypothetical protein VHO29_03375 [Marmoricola sp.]|nr:hypothetical protein [Marmoricola sp.]
MEYSPRMRVLLDAGVAVVATHGMRGLTHRAVDRTAGLAEGSCSAYLRTRLALLTALADYVASEIAESTRALTERISAHNTGLAKEEADTAYAVDQTVAMFVDLLDRPALVRTLFELSLEGGRHQELRAVTTAWSAQLTTLVGDVLRQKGFDDAGERAATLVAAMEGVLLRAMREDQATQRAFLRTSLEMLMRALVADAVP